MCVANVALKYQIDGSRNKMLCVFIYAIVLEKAENKATSRSHTIMLPVTVRSFLKLGTKNIGIMSGLKT